MKRARELSERGSGEAARAADRNGVSVEGQELIQWLSRQGWRFTVSTGGRTIVAHGTVAAEPVVVTASGESQNQALRQVLGAVAARALASEPHAAAAR